jgi:hypothetical protein
MAKIGRCVTLLLVFTLLLSCTNNYVYNQTYNASKCIMLKARATLVDDKGSKKCHVRLFINRNKEIFFFVTSGLGLNVIKGHIHAKGITMINAIDKSYYNYSYRDISMNMHISVDYSFIKSLILAEISHNRLKLKKKVEDCKNIYRYQVGNTLFETYFDKIKNRIFYSHIYFLNTYNHFRVHYCYKNDEALFYNSLIFYLCIKNKLEISEQEIHLEGVSYKLLDERKSVDFSIPKGYVKK